jgi:LysM repeat protein
VARILAVMALVIAAIVVIVVVSSSLGGSDESSEANRPAETQKQDEKKAKYYVVEPGDTFAGIAAEQGISVPRLEELNPNLDTQLLPEQGCVNLVPEGCKILAEGG